MRIVKLGLSLIPDPRVGGTRLRHAVRRDDR
jgi:hypothetical protein